MTITVNLTPGAESVVQRVEQVNCDLLKVIELLNVVRMGVQSDELISDAGNRAAMAGLLAVALKRVEAVL